MSKVEKLDRPCMMYYMILVMVPIEVALFVLCCISILATGATIDLRVTVMGLLLLVVSYAGGTFSNYYLKVSSYRVLLVKICRVIHVLFCLLMMACCVIGCL